MLILASAPYCGPIVLPLLTISHRGYIQVERLVDRSFGAGIMPCETQRKFGKYRLICLHNVLQLGGLVSNKPAAKYVFSRLIGLLNCVE